MAEAYLPTDRLVAVKPMTVNGVLVAVGDDLPSIDPMRTKQLIRTRFAKLVRSAASPKPVVVASAPFACDVCGRPAKTKLALGAHKRVHK